MHCVCLGTVRRIFTFLMKGPLHVKISRQQVNLISSRLISLSRCFPQEFARKPRSLVEFERFKATEFRTLLLYSGPLVLKGIVNNSVYSHFMSLHVAIFILTHPEKCKMPNYLNHASDLLYHFVENASLVYGQEFVTCNIHSLLHIPEDCKKFGPLDSYSCFPFENYLSFIKKLVRNGKHPLAQVKFSFSVFFNICYVFLPGRLLEKFQKVLFLNSRQDKEN